MVHDDKTVYCAGFIDPEGFLLFNSSFRPTENFTGKVKWTNGTKRWYKEGYLHREDGPAMDHYDGFKAWYKNGKLHRTDGPAVEHPDGSMEWWYEGVRGLENFPPELKKKLTRKFIHGT